MAFQDPADEAVDYDNDNALDQTDIPGGHAVLDDEEDLVEDDDDDDYEDLYGDVNVGMYAPPQVSDPARRNAAQNGDVDAVTENENGADDLQVELVPPRDAGAISVPTPKEESVEYDYLPDVKEETLYDNSDVGPSKPKVASEQLPSKASAPKGGTSVGGGANGTEGGAGRGGWPAGSGPAGGQAGNAVAVANNSSGGGGGGGGGGGMAGKQGGESGGLMLFVGELQWWTTDAELEAALSEYGRMKNLKFFEEKASGKSKGYCQVEFFDAGAARVCKDKMDGRVFNGRACVVAFASPQTIKQMGAAQVGKNQASAQSQGQPKKAADGRNGGAGGGGGQGGQGGDGRGGFGKGGRGQAAMERERGGRGSSQAPGRGGRGGRGPLPGGMMAMGGPPGGMMAPRGMMGPGGFEPGFGPPGGGYGMVPGGVGFGPRGPMFGPPFAPMGPGLAGVPAHVNPAFFGRSNGPGPGMEGGPPGGWGEVGMPSWEEHQRHLREGGYAGPEEMAAGEFGYGGGEMGRAGPGTARERERGGAGEGEWGAERRRREERSGERGGEEWERGERHRGGGEREGHRERERGEHREKEKEWDRGERGSGRGAREKDERTQSREDDHGKRRRVSGDRDRKAER